ncbi:MAG TPA: histidine kinase, partial [Bryobacteraceae bacterium]
GLTYLWITRDEPDYVPPFAAAETLRVSLTALLGRWRMLPALAASDRGFNILFLSGSVYLYATIRVAAWILGTVRLLTDAAVWRPGVIPAFPYSRLDSFMIGAFAGGWLAIQALVVSAIYARLPEPQRHTRIGRFLRLFGSSVATQFSDQRWNELSLNPRPEPAPLVRHEDLSSEIKGLIAVLVWCVLAIVPWGFHERLTSLDGLSRTWATLALQLVMPLVLMPLVYYKTQFLFFDVLIKRGVLVLVLLASSVAYFAAVFQLPLSGLARATAIWASAVVFTLFWTWFYGVLNSILDHYLFRRPDYRKLLKEIAGELPGFIESGALLAHVGEQLRRALSADFVRFGESPNGPSESEAAASVAVSTPGRTWGWFQFGPREKGQPYRSEDFQFLEAIAAQVAALLENFARRRELEEQRRREAQLRELAARSELKALRAQINPHFLFNALNTLADLTQANPKLAESLVLALADVFRFALDATRHDEVRLGDEIEFLEAYLKIEEARFGPKLRHTIDVPPALREYLVPPMLIQPLLENAIRHGIAPRPEGGSVTIRAGLEEKMLVVAVEDDGVGFDPQRVRPSGGGVGLSNVRDRIEHLAGPDRWHVSSTPGAGASVVFEIAAKTGERDYAGTAR